MTNQQPICTKCNQPITSPDKVVSQGTGNFHYNCFKMPQPITSCHHISTVVVGSDEGTNHYECPECHGIVDIDGSNPNQPDTPNELTTILLQYDAEKKQGLNELAGHGTAIEQAERALQAYTDRERREELVKLVNAEIIKPEYHNVVVGRIGELKNEN